MPPRPSKLLPPFTGYTSPMDTLDTLIDSLQQLSDFVPLRRGFYGFRAQTD